MQERKNVVATGVISLITFFTVLLLTSLSFLILSTARTDSELAVKTAEAVTQHYTADREAEVTLFELHSWYRESGGLTAEQLKDKGFTLLTDEEFDGVVVEYTVPINDKKDLYIKVGFPTGKDSVERLSWKAVSRPTQTESTTPLWG